jgi:hypothetical protein
MALNNDYQAYKSFIGERGKNMNRKAMTFLRWEGFGFGFKRWRRVPTFGDIFPG